MADSLSTIIKRTDKRRTLLHENLVFYSEQHKMRGHIGPRALRFIDTETTGRFFLGTDNIVFEHKKDAVAFWMFTQ